MLPGKNLERKKFKPKIRFFIGAVDDEDVEEELKKEAEQFGDICRVSLVESYQGLLRKVIKPILILLCRSCQEQYILSPV